MPPVSISQQKPRGTVSVCLSVCLSACIRMLVEGKGQNAGESLGGVWVGSRSNARERLTS